MMKKIMVILVLIGLVVSPVFSGGSKESAGTAKQTVLRLGHDQSDGHPYDLGVKKFAEGLTKGTNGAFQVKIYPAAQLGNSPEQIEGLNLGTLDIALSAFSHVTGFVKELDLFGAPFLFETDAHFGNVFDGEIGRTLDAACRDKYSIRLQIGRAHV